jgi:hypothetical protein
MGRNCYLLWVVLAIVAGMLPARTDARGRKGATYAGVIDFGSQLLHLDDGCVAVDGRVEAGNFFEDLKRVDTGSQSEYRKGGTVVTQYPESVTTSIRMMGGQCAAALADSPSAIFGGGSYSLTFGVEWKDGMEMRPAILTPVVARCVGARITTDPSKDVTFPELTCRMTVDSKGVPLGHHLIVSVFSADGKRLTRLSAAP